MQLLSQLFCFGEETDTLMVFYNQLQESIETLKPWTFLPPRNLPNEKDMVGRTLQMGFFGKIRELSSQSLREFFGKWIQFQAPPFKEALAKNKVAVEDHCGSSMAGFSMRLVPFVGGTFRIFGKFVCSGQFLGP